VNSSKPRGKKKRMNAIEKQTERNDGVRGDKKGGENSRKPIERV
jgi:hypothetical protein